MGFQFISYLYNILSGDLNYKFDNWICWHYTQGIGKKKGFSPRHEDILMFHKSSSFTFNLDEIRVPQKYYRTKNNMRGANPRDMWLFSHVHYCNQNRQEQPTQKPEGIIERMLLASSIENFKQAIIETYGLETLKEVFNENPKKNKRSKYNTISLFELLEERYFFHIPRMNYPAFAFIVNSS